MLEIISVSNRQWRHQTHGKLNYELLKASGGCAFPYDSNSLLPIWLKSLLPDSEQEEREIVWLVFFPFSSKPPAELWAGLCSSPVPFLLWGRVRGFGTPGPTSHDRQTQDLRKEGGSQRIGRSLPGGPQAARCSAGWVTIPSPPDFRMAGSGPAPSGPGQTSCQEQPLVSISFPQHN